MTDATTEDYPVWFALPSYFYEIPLYGREAQQARDQLIDMLTSASGDVEEDQRAAGAVLAGYDIVVETLRDEQALHFGVCLLRDEDTGNLTTAFLSLFARYIPRGDRRLAVAAAVQGVRSAEPDAVVRPVQLPCGPAAVVSRELTTATSPTEGHSTDAGRGDVGDAPPVSQVQYMVPYPNGGRMYVLDLTTTFVRHWATYAEIADGIAHGLCFDDPFEALAREKEVDALRTRVHDALGSD